MISSMRRFLAIVLIGATVATASAMDAQEALAKADQLYAEGTQSEEALLLYQSIVDNGQDAICVLLSKLKIAYIYEEQLLQYDDAITAYHRFISDYPDNRLTKIVINASQQLEKLRDEGSLNDYREYRRLEKNYRILPSDLHTPQEQEKHKKAAAKKLYSYAKMNYSLSFGEEIAQQALFALAQEGFFFTAYRFLHFIKINLPASKFADEEIRETIYKGILTAFARIFIGLCILFILLGKGFKPAYQTIKTHRKGLLIGVAAVLLYMTVYQLITMKYDIYLRWNHLFFVVGVCLLLIPASVLLSHSFDYLKSNPLRNITIGIVCTLLGISCWILFAEHFGFLLTTRI